MTPSVFAISESLITVLGHSLWQATIIAVLVAILLRCLPARHANLRYAIATGGLGVAVVSLFVTWSVLRLGDHEFMNSNSGSSIAMASGDLLSPPATPSPRVFNAASATGTDSHLASVIQFDAKSISSSPSSATVRKRLLIEVLASIWVVGAVVMLLRGLIGQVAIRQWLVESTTELMDLDGLKQIVQELSVRLGLRRVVQIAVSQRLSVPAVVGFLSPVILVPPAMLMGIPIDQWRIILAHELAHVRRWDAIVNLAQLVIESLLFFNPAVWWISRQIRVEREACCDALAAKICGQPLSVAWALVDVATVATSGFAQPRLQGSLAFAEPSNEGELTDRVRRLIDPNRTPHSKVSWTGFGVVLFAIVCVAVVLNRSTELAVRATAAWMSPKERVDKLVQLEAERNGIFLPPATSNDANFVSASGTQEGTAANQIPVELIVRMEDGSHLTNKLDLRAIYQSGNSSTSTTLSSPREDVAEYRHTLKLTPCQLRIGASLRGEATAVSPLIAVLPDGQERKVELILSRGTSVHTIIQNELGEPIPNARLRTAVLMHIRGSGSTLSMTDLQADDQGRVEIDHVIPVPYSLDLLASGYQRLTTRQGFDGSQSYPIDSPLVLRMRSARPTPVRVIDATTGEPIKQARLRIVHIQESNFGMSYGFRRQWDAQDLWNDYAITDEDGRAVLDQLRDDATYSFAVVAPKFAIALLETQAGQAESTTKLGRPLTLSGQLTGSLDRLQRRTDGRPGYQFSTSSRLSDHVNDSGWVFVDEDGRFNTESFSPGEHVTLFLPDKRYDIVMKESLNDLKYEVKPAEGPSSIPRRDVLIRLTGVSPDAPARGLMYVSWQHPTIRNEIQNGPMPLRGNEIRLQIPVEARLNFHEQEIAGYRVSAQDQIEITAGSDLLIIDVPVTAMGGIYGSLTRADGSPADGAFVRVFPVALPATEKNDHHINPSVSSAGPQYLREVPIGGRYRILATEKSATGYVWAVSDEVTIDGEHPIAQADIQLPSGRDLAIKILDEAGQPVIDQPVELEVSFQVKGSSAGSSSSVSAKTDTTGIALFRGLAVDRKLDPVTWSLTAVVKPSTYRGVSLPIDSNRPVSIRLMKGVAAAGIVVDTKSRKPIPNAEVRVVPRRFNEATYKGAAVTRTDAEGRFKFLGLEPIEYTGYVSDTSPLGTIIEPIADGGYRYHYPKGVEQHVLLPGKDARWEVLINPGSRLKPAE